MARSRGSGGTVNHSTYGQSMAASGQSDSHGSWFPPKASFLRDLGRDYKTFYDRLGNPSTLLFLRSIVKQITKADLDSQGNLNDRIAKN